jgi:cation:H+ antiporter
MDWILLITGLIVLLVGGDLLVRGATAISHRLGISTRLIGMTIIALGTSMPELAVNLSAAMRGDTAIVFGNLVGSNISNLGLVLGISLLVSAIKIDRVVIRRDISIMVGISLLAVAMSHDQLWSQNTNAINSYDGVLLLLFFIVIFAWTLRSGKASQLKMRLVKIYPDPALVQVPNDEEPAKDATNPSSPKGGWFGASIMMLAGLVGILGGSDLTVEGAGRVAQTLGISQTIVGLTILAIGTSLPELVTCLIASAKGYADMALGNVIGSNIINLSLILGVSSVTHNVAIPAHGQIDLWVMLGAALALWAAAGFGRKKLTSVDGLLFLGGYITYIVLRTMLSAGT